jgi:endonuclease/exonuclease/phosphatase (EEP) superfamily protein YafD
MRTLRIVLMALITPPVFIGVLACALAAVFAWLGRGSDRFDLLTHFAPVFFATGVAALAFALLLKGVERGALVALGTVAAIAAGGLILPELTRSAGPKAPKDAPGQIKVVQFNVWFHNRNLDRVAAWLREEDPDFAILEETGPALRQRLVGDGRWHVSCRECEVVILSKRAPASSSRPRTRVKADGPLARATFRDQLGEFTVIGTHYAWPTEPERHQKQEARLAEVIGLSNRKRTIVAGDLNSTPWSFSRRRWDKAFGLIRRDRAVFSWPARQPNRYRWLGILPFLAIDHVYAGEAWATVSVRRGPPLGSDHYPLIVTLAPRAPR